MGVIIAGDFKVVHIKRYFVLNVFVLMRFHCIYILKLSWYIEREKERKEKREQRGACVMRGRK